MKKQTKTYLLLAVVLGIWGTIAYKIISAIDPEEELVLEQQIITDFTPEEITIDTFSLVKLKRDPFLGKLYSNNNRKLAKTNTSTKSKIEEFYPEVKYLGTVKKQGGKNQVYVLTINNNQYLLKKGQVAEEVKLLKATNTEAVVSFKNKIKTIKK